MRKWIVGTVCGVALGLSSSISMAKAPPSLNSITENPAPAVKYPVTPTAGDYLILAKAYKENKRATVSAQSMAEDLAEYIRSAMHQPAFIEVRNWKEKAQEDARVKAELARLRAEWKKLGIEPEDGKVSVKRMQIDIEYAVLIAPGRGSWKEIDAARKFLDEVRKWKTPPEILCDKIVIAPNQRTAADQLTSRAVNPFTTAFVVRNPTIPHDDAADKAREEKEEVEVMKKINAGQDFNVFNCPKKYTLVVKGFAGNTVVESGEKSSPSTKDKLFGSPKQSLLDAGARQAEEFAQLLVRASQDPKSNFKLKPYVLHTKHGSYVSVGGFDSDNDEAINAAKRAFTSLKLLQGASGVAEGADHGLLANPLPMRIPGR